MSFKVEKSETVYQGFLSVTRQTILFDGFDGTSIQREHEVVDRGDSAGILIFDKSSNSLILSKQFRLPPALVEGEDYLVEIAAGRMESNESPEACIRRETREELGYELKDLETVGTYYLSPGACKERMFIFFSEVSSTDFIHEGGGNKDENEDIQIERMNVNQLENIIQSGMIKDAKTMIALQWFAANKLS